MDYATMVNVALFVLSLGLGVVGWLARQLWDAVQSLRDDVRKIEVALPTNYVAKSDLAEYLDRIERKLDRLGEKLDAKVDR